MAQCVHTLKSWAGKAKANIVYDSTVDEFTNEGLFDKIKGKPTIAIVGFTSGGDVFGGFYNVAVTQQDERFYDPNIFAFSFESHGRCETPQRFVVKEGLKNKAYVYINKNDRTGFVWFGVYGGDGFRLGNESSQPFCKDMSHGFDGIEDTTLSGKTDQSNGPNHHFTRLVAIQLQ